MHTLFARLIAAERTRSRSTQRVFAQRLRISQALLSQWENGGALPRAQRLPALAKSLDVKLDDLRSAYEQSRGPAAPEPRRALGVEELHGAARAHVLAHGPKRLDIWVIGGTNLTVMKRAELLEKRWKENLLWGVSYNLLWPLDLVDEEKFGTVLATLSGLARKAAAEHGAFLASSKHDPSRPAWLDLGAANRPGAINHFALSIFDAPRRAMRDVYARLAAAEAGGAHGVVHGFVPGHDGSAPLTGAAARRIMRVWHPETGIVAYRPLDAATPAAANIRLMPVTEKIVARLSPELEESNYWFWLTPAGARRVANAVADFEEAVAIEGKA